MKTEDVLFRIFNEIVLLSELYEELSQEQVVTTIETVSAWFSELPPEVISRYNAFLKDSIEREKSRGAARRAAILDHLATTFGDDG
jgi:hypothetical protein